MGKIFNRNIRQFFTSSLDLATFDMDCLPKDNCVILVASGCQSEN